MLDFFRKDKKDQPCRVRLRQGLGKCLLRRRLISWLRRSWSARTARGSEKSADCNSDEGSGLDQFHVFTGLIDLLAITATFRDSSCKPTEA